MLTHTTISMMEIYVGRVFPTSNLCEMWCEYFPCKCYIIFALLTFKSKDEDGDDDNEDEDENEDEDRDVEEDDLMDGCGLIL